MQDFEDKLIDYLDDELTAEQRLEVEHALEKSAELRQTFEELKLVMNSIDNAKEIQPSNNLKHNFDEFLQNEKEKFHGSNLKIVDLKRSNNNRKRLFLQIAVAAAILLLGIFVGKNLGTSETVKQEDLIALRTEMLDLLQKENSTSGRIKAVNISYEMEEVDDEIVAALIQTMNVDPSVNVRLAAMDALFEFANESKVRTALCETLNHQTNPMIQLSIIKMLVDLKEKQALKYFEHLVEKDETSQEVKDEAQMGIFKIM